MCNKNHNIMEIDITKEIERFHQFLNIENNENIIFSGIFGIGKSYFIDKYFNHSYKEDYIPIYLTPVNYSVANNEDIFEYIKVDILMQLLQKTPCEFRDEKINFSVGAYFYLKNNAIDLLSSIATMAEKVKFGTDIISKLIKLKSNIDQFITDNSKNEEKETLDFINAMSFQKGSIYENNAITQIIQSLIKNAKSNDQPAKEIVLVIDDLDRIDPEHIFRILNILSAHNNFCGTDENKFGFDKTILVCDIDNIKHIYSAKYGINVDFNGYIDKFYSKEIYTFDNANNIISKLSSMLMTVVAPGESDIHINTQSSNNFSISCKIILSGLINNHSISLRTLLNNMNSKYFNHRTKTYYGEVNPANFGSIIIFKFIRSLFCTPKCFQDAIYNLQSHHLDLKSPERYHALICSFIILADYGNNKLKAGSFTYEEMKYTIPEGVVSHGTAFLNRDVDKPISIKPIELIKNALDNYTTKFANL